MAGPTGLRLLSPSPLCSLGGLCSPAAFLPRGWEKPALGKGLLGPWPPAPPPALLWNLMYLKTHTQIFMAQPGSALRHSQAGAAKKKKKKNRSSGLFTALVLWSFSCFLCLSRTPGLPRPWGPRVQAFGSGSWQMSYLFVTERREVGDKSLGKSSSSLALVSVRRLVSIRRVGPGRAWGD